MVAMVGKRLKYPGGHEGGKHFKQNKGDIEQRKQVEESIWRWKSR